MNVEQTDYEQTEYEQTEYEQTYDEQTYDGYYVEPVAEIYEEPPYQEPYQEPYETYEEPDYRPSYYAPPEPTEDLEVELPPETNYDDPNLQCYERTCDQNITGSITFNFHTEHF